MTVTCRLFRRPGGRIASAAFGDTIVDIGGVWDDGEAVDAETNYMTNPVMYHAEKLGLVIFPE